jgi:hypothetical protein
MQFEYIQKLIFIFNKYTIKLIIDTLFYIIFFRLRDGQTDLSVSGAGVGRDHLVALWVPVWNEYKDSTI